MLKRKKVFLLLFSITLIGATLRLYQLSSIPPALHGDELGIGYNAYSLLKTGKDEYGKILPLFFRNDFAPLVFYLAVPFIGLLGLNEFATRLPAVFFSILAIPVTCIFVKKLFNNYKLALLTGLFTAISSWDIRISRITVGINIPLLLQISAIILFFKAKQLKTIDKKYLIYSFLLFSLSTLAYQSAKMTTPLIIFGLFIIYKSELRLKKNLGFYITLFSLFIILPIIHYLTSYPVGKMRITGISVFTLWRSTLANKTNFLSYLLPSNLFPLVKMIFLNYFKHFDPKILFFDNSNLRYHQLPSIGLFYPWQIIFIVIGFFSFLKLIIKKEVKFIFYWLLISPSASALTSGVPYANISRALMMLPAIELFCAAGVISFFYFVKKLTSVKLHGLTPMASSHSSEGAEPFRSIPLFAPYGATKGYPPIYPRSNDRGFTRRRVKLNFLFCLLLTIIFSINLTFFIKTYFITTAKDNSDFWGAHLKEMVQYILPFEKSADKIIISNSLSPQTYMYILFYGKKEPQWLFDNKGNLADIVGYSSFGKYEFRPINWKEDKNIRNALIVGTSSEIPVIKNNLVKEIRPANEEITIRIVKNAE